MSGLLRGGATGAALIIVLLVLPLVLLRGGMSRDEVREQAIILANLTQGLSAARALQLRVGEHLATHGALPADASALGLDATAAARHQGVALGDGGVITVYVPAAQGTLAGRLRLTPQATPGHDIEWACHTSDFRNIARHVPRCRYQENAP